MTKTVVQTANFCCERKKKAKTIARKRVPACDKLVNPYLTGRFKYSAFYDQVLSKQSLRFTAKKTCPNVIQHNILNDFPAVPQ